ncbi:pleckstrin domain-containing protein [Heterostelium album PN500]|uniref:Pleckstrin domain-containing protein n=1 Tax=Heterostelium pallidum (strain ATCC 26659 / Pp 5 / PN500) TaxID=670386 RepID=D3BLZ2_HETP5|nr:pleckstrin domain-containing protein [Heterostelium album PN500]EFA77593.1 pleckstrin domain-containing protein [Heterostelium album PN500]|eukprot:XP_020429721.1 pleckstrin domain-containing protein [Heterostelium album PN500]
MDVQLSEDNNTINLTSNNNNNSNEEKIEKSLDSLQLNEQQEQQQNSNSNKINKENKSSGNLNGQVWRSSKPQNVSLDQLQQSCSGTNSQQNSNGNVDSNKDNNTSPLISLTPRDKNINNSPSPATISINSNSNNTEDSNNIKDNSNKDNSNKDNSNKDNSSKDNESNSNSNSNSNNGSFWWLSKFKIGSLTNNNNNNNNTPPANTSTKNEQDSITLAKEKEKEKEKEKDEDDGEILYHTTPSSKIIKEGYLNKQGHLRKNWLQRYFILTDISLEYYKEKGQPLLNQIPLTECAISLADTETKKSFCFKISHATRKSFYLYSCVSGSDIERDSYEWIGAIQEVIDNLAATAAAVATPKEVQIVTEDHPSYELVHAISNALLFSLGKTSAAHISSLVDDDFSAYEQQTYTTSSSSSSNSSGGNSKSAGQSLSYKFVDYAPKVFRKIRELSNVNPADYMISLTRDTLTEIPTPGRSNSLFYFTSDKKYLIKTITTSEYDHLRSILQNYYEHLSQYKDSLLVKYFGLHHISPSKMKNTYFVVMENIFENRHIDETYDLKGSTLNRKAETGKSVLMDLDFCTRIFISDEMKILFFKQIEIDCSFLEKVFSMDYSLLLGISYLHGKKVDTDVENERLSIFKRENGGMISRTPDGEHYDRVYYIAIIDMLTTYNIKKQIEHTYKATLYDTKDSMSAVDPTTYNKRFKQYLTRITGWTKLQT